MKKIKNIVIVSRTWFDRVNGNSYYSAHCLINGELKASLGFSDGYGSQITYAIFSKLEELKIVKLEHYPNGSTEAPFRYCEKIGATLLSIDTPVQLKGLVVGWEL